MISLRSKQPCIIICGSTGKEVRHYDFHSEKFGFRAADSHTARRICVVPGEEMDDV
jgi:hypothetical protein